MGKNRFGFIDRREISITHLTIQNADLVIANDVGKKERGFDAETNEVYIVDKNKKVKHVNLADKRIIGNKILDEIRKIKS